jgi:DNA invertase Pin-like site-specific DNA recombinase
MSNVEPVAVYCRMSDDKQENSIERQQSLVVPWCEVRGYQIVREYSDRGIAGDEIAKRKDFQRMLRDAQAGLFRGIVCDDKDRFGRFDSIDLGEIAAPLRRKGVWVESVAQGRIDWESFSGRVTDAVLQEAKKIESQAISHRTLSGMLLKARNGEFLGGPACYGYRLEADGQGRKRYVPDGRKAEVVKLIFRMCADGHTLGQIAEELYQRGVDSPSGNRRWSRNGILKILHNRRYAGDSVWGVQAVGKYHLAGAKGPRRRQRLDKRFDLNPPADWVVVPETHEALVDRETFERCQSQLHEGRRFKGRPPGTAGHFVLSKLLVCGHCGSFMLGFTRRGRRMYSCGGYMAYGRTHCNHNSIPERPVLTFLIRKLQEAFLDKDNLRKLREEVAGLEKEMRGEDNLERLRRQADTLGRKINNGLERIADLPRELVADMGAKVSAWKEERAKVQAELRRIETESPVKHLEQKIADAEGVLWRLQEVLQAEDNVLLRQLLRELVSRIELRWTHYETAHTSRSRLEGGIVYLRPQEELSITFPTGTRNSIALRTS